jgi:sortase (surface protein transpeptidase)
MLSTLATLLQLALSLLASAQSDLSMSLAQKQQATLTATQAIQFVTQALPGTLTSSSSSSQSPSLPSSTVVTAIGAVGDGFPVRLVIPKLNIDAGFQYDGLTSSGIMETPTNVSDVGWFTGSPLPGAKGVSIVIGHVAQVRKGVVTKQGVFGDLGSLVAGDQFYILNNRGESTTFVVRESRSYDPAADTTDVFTTADGGAHLNFVTCEGTWDPAQLEYTQRLVVFTDAVQ